MSKNLDTLVRIRRLARTGDARHLRETAGLSLMELAAELHVAPSTLSRWETGKTSPRARVALRWASILSELAVGSVSHPATEATAHPEERSA